jgi:protein-disulfide isomerase
MNRRAVVIGTGVVALGGFAAGAWYFRTQEQVQRTEVAQSQPSALSRAHSPVLGAESAKVTIVEFLDPACESCRAFAPMVKRLVTTSFGQVKLVVRYAPLHPPSEQAIRLLEAARMQDKYPQALDAVFESQPAWASHSRANFDAIWPAVAAAGVDIDKAKAAMNDPAITKIIEADKADLAALQG